GVGGVGGVGARRPNEDDTLVGSADDKREGQLTRRLEEPDDPWQAARDSLPDTGLRHGRPPLLLASVIRKPHVVAAPPSAWRSAGRFREPTGARLNRATRAASLAPTVRAAAYVALRACAHRPGTTLSSRSV